MITKEEKAKEIAQSFRTARMFSKHPCEIAEDAAKQMAQWKEQQMIEKAVSILRDEIKYHDIYEESDIETFRKRMMEE